MTTQPFPNPLTRATVQVFVEQYFLPDHVATLSRARQARYHEVLDQHILPAIGKVRFGDVNVP